MTHCFGEQCTEFLEMGPVVAVSKLIFISTYLVLSTPSNQVSFRKKKKKKKVVHIPQRPYWLVRKGIFSLKAHNQCLIHVCPMLNAGLSQL